MLLLLLYNREEGLRRKDTGSTQYILSTMIASFIQLI